MNTSKLFELSEQEFDKELYNMTKSELRIALAFAWGYISQSKHALSISEK